MEIIISHRLPGRLRIAVEGIRNQPVAAYQLEQVLSVMCGIRGVRCNADTGRTLVLFDEQRVSPDDVVGEIDAWMAARVPGVVPRDAIAATLETEVLTDDARQTPWVEPRTNPYLVPAVASAGTFGALTVKRIALGRSALALSPLSFWAAAGVSIVAGYPAIRRGVEQLLIQRKVTPDLWMGLATLGMAAIRENLVALSVITALNIMMYRRHRLWNGPEDTVLEPNLERYSQKLTRRTMWLAPLTFLLTRSPLRAVAVALANNPRPALVSHKYRWAKAEQEAWKQGLLVDVPGGLTALATAQSIVFTDEAQIRTGEPEWVFRSISETCDSAKACAIAASLLKNCPGHPWHDLLLERAKQQDRTIHTAFGIENSDDGVRGRIQGHDIMLGTTKYLNLCGIDDTPILMEERRLRRQGFLTQVLVVERYPVAVIGCKRAVAEKWKNLVSAWEKMGYRVRSLQPQRSSATAVDPVTPDQLIREAQAGARTIVIGDGTFVDEQEGFIRIGAADIGRLSETLRFCRATEGFARRDVAILKGWNLLGTALAIAVPLSAPLIALSGDVVGMLLLALQERPGVLAGRLRRTKQLAAKARDTNLKHGKVPYHALDSSEVLSQLGADLGGLTTAQAQERLAIWGTNELPSPEPPSLIVLFLRQFKDLSMVILLGTAGLSFVMGERFSALCMLGILVINAFVSTWQEKHSMDVIQGLTVSDDSETRVIRDRLEQRVPSAGLVPGDVVLLESGDKVPADVRVFEGWNLEVNEAMFTGESLPVAKRLTSLPQDTPLADRANCLFMGTLVTRGRCKGVVVATGRSTEMGALGCLMQSQEVTPTFLQNRVNQISKRFVIGAFIAAGVVATAGLFRGIPPLQLVIQSVTLAASAIPEGLPLTITVALTAGVLQMSKRRAVVKKLGNLESLGRVTVICSDKTGTLTKNEMTVQELVTVNQKLRIAGNQFTSIDDQVPQASEDVPLSDLKDPDVVRLLTVGLLCNNAKTHAHGQKPVGDPTEVALLRVAAGANVQDEFWKRHREIPFDSVTRSMSVVCEEVEQSHVVCEDSGTLQKCTLFSKGAVEAILAKCSHYTVDGQVHAMSEAIEQSIRDENTRMASNALRVLAFAYRDIDDDEDPLQAVDDQLIFVGLMGMIDPPKESVRESITEARRLGIRPVMITGDHPITARAIGQELGIFRPGERVLTGREIDELADADLDSLTQTTSIFARVSPEHKLRIVQSFQRQGEVVAMTGDGMNDAPAIQRADVGIAMGLRGTEMTKGTAGIVLMEDHFDAILDGVKRGRVIVGNIRKAMGCLLAGNLAEVLVTALSVVIGLPMPLIPMQILLMNILTDAIPAMVLATGSHDDVPDEPYRDVIDKPLLRTVLARGCVLGLGAVGVFAASLAAGVPLPIAQTMTYASMIVGQLFQTSSWRKYGTKRQIRLHHDKVLFTATMGSLAALAATVYVPALRSVFSTVPLGLKHWAIVVLVTSGLTWTSRRFIEWWSAGERRSVSKPSGAYGLATA